MDTLNEGVMNRMGIFGGTQIKHTGVRGKGKIHNDLSFDLDLQWRGLWMDGCAFLQVSRAERQTRAGLGGFMAVPGESMWRVLEGPCPG